jgi:tetratricopeptide (TPR) repeat protein
VRTLVAIAVLIAAVVPARADNLKEAKAHFKEGSALYQSGDFEGAIVEFDTAYRFSPIPDILFNIAQAYRMRGKKAQAHKYYSRYLESKPKGTLADEAREHVVTLTKELADEAEARAAKARAEAAAAVKPVVVAPPQPPPPPPPKVPVYKRWWLWTVVGVVAVGAGVGIGLGVSRAPANFSQTFPDVGPARAALGVRF